MNKSAGTIRLYRINVQDFLERCDGSVENFNKGNVIAWVAELLESGLSPETVRSRLNAVKQFAGWMEGEGVIDAASVRSVKAPKLHNKPVPALTEGQVSEMLRAADGKSLRDRRDRALIYLLAETGMRASEVLSLREEDISPVDRIAVIRKSKTGEARHVRFSAQAAAAVDRYMRSRRALGRPGGLWLGRFGDLTYKGLRYSLTRRAEQAGIKGFHIHRFRHTAAVRWLNAGGSETGLMAQAGWKSRDMIGRYVKSSAEDLAAQEFDRLSLGFGP